MQRRISERNISWNNVALEQHKGAKFSFTVRDVKDPDIFYSYHAIFYI